MAYPAQGRRIIDETKRLDITRLIKAGYLEPGKRCSGPITWSETFQVMGHLGVYGPNHPAAGTGELVLNYIRDEEHICQRVAISSRPSNLPQRSLIYFFVCRDTKKLCRKLYFNGREFVHLSQIDGLYESQVRSKKARDTEKLLSYVLGEKDIYEQLSQKHLKRWYNGKPTKKYLNLLQWKKRVSQITVDDIDRLFITGSF